MNGTISCPGFSMSHLTITNAAELTDLIRRLEHAPVIAYDTEFISEGRYRPLLCLVQLAANGTLAIVDPISVGNLDPLWNLFCDGKREIVVHACRSELEFCFRGIGKIPPRLFDVQVAAGFLGIDFPAGFRTLLEKVLGIDISKAEARTEWNKRPLTPRQIDYALGDVRHLEEMSRILRERLTKQGRLAWFNEEMDYIKTRHRVDFETPRWRNTAKSSSLKPRELAILRELWLWRESHAKKLNQPTSRVLRDDLLVELAKRGTADPERIADVRGLQRGDLHRILPELCTAVRHALELRTEELPGMSERMSFPQYSVMSQFLFSALCLIGKRKHLSQQLIGGPSDVRELIATEFGTIPEGIKPRLLNGWRAEFVGNQLDDLLNGRTAIRLDRNNPDEPLTFFTPSF